MTKLSLQIWFHFLWERFSDTFIYKLFALVTTWLPFFSAHSSFLPVNSINYYNWKVETLILRIEILGIFILYVIHLGSVVSPHYAHSYSFFTHFFVIRQWLFALIIVVYKRATLLSQWKEWPLIFLAYAFLEERKEWKETAKRSSLLVITCYVYATRMETRFASLPFLSRARNAEVARKEDPLLAIPSLSLSLSPPLIPLSEKNISYSKRKNSKLIKRKEAIERKKLLFERPLFRIILPIF